MDSEINEHRKTATEKRVPGVLSFQFKKYLFVRLEIQINVVIIVKNLGICRTLVMQPMDNIDCHACQLPRAGSNDRNQRLVSAGILCSLGGYARPSEGSDN